jgi:peptidoglycan/LPS O-acetylase OafA/YrhL
MSLTVVPQGAPVLQEEPSSGELPYIPQLDGLRGIACLLVLITHLRSVHCLRKISDVIATGGVGIFFVLSGFLITRILIADKARGRGLNEFYDRRVARIFPIYFLLLAILALAWPGQELGWAADFSFNMRYVTQLREYFHIDAPDAPIPPVAHFWSLCVEEHFYWFWPLIIFLLPARLYRLVPVLCILATPFITSVAFQTLLGHKMYFGAAHGLVSRLTFTQLVGLCLGSIAAFHERRLLAGTVGWRRFHVRLAPLIGGTAVVLGVCGIKFIKGWWEFHDFRVSCFTTLLHTLCFGLFCIGLSSSWLGRTRWLRSVGRISYGLYLYHLPIYAALGLAQAGEVSAARGLLAFVTTFAVAILSFHYFELPILRWVRQRGEQGRPRRRLRLSLGSLVTAALGVSGCYQAYRFVRDYPQIPRTLWRVSVTKHDISKLPRFAGACDGYWWMGVMHAIDSNGYRRHTPIPAKVRGVPRVVLIGDSRTWGACVPEALVMDRVAQRRLDARGIPIELLNIGEQGGAVQAILERIRLKALPLHPDMIIYPAGYDDLADEDQRSGPPGSSANPLHVNRFRAAVLKMHELCRDRGIRFAIIPLLCNPSSPVWLKRTKIIPEVCNATGIPVISIDDFARRNSTRTFAFSEWDVHPDMEFHRQYGEIIADYLLAHPLRTN